MEYYKQELRALQDRYCVLVNQSSRELREKDEYINELRKENERLKQKLRLAEQNTPSHNARGAGRKSKATPENIAEVLRLRNEGYSYGNIADAITRATGEYICKSTVAKIAWEHNRT